MSGVEIPALGRKLRLLINNGGYEDWQALANEFGLAAKTIQWWGHGDSARPGNILPHKHLKRLLNILSEQFPEKLSDEHARELLFAPIKQFESTFSSSSLISLNALISKEAFVAKARLFKKGQGNKALVQVDKATPSPEYMLNLGDMFRLEIERRIAGGFVILLQNVGTSWGLVPCEIRGDADFVDAPPFDQSELPQFMSETVETGFHRFILIEAAMPFSSDLKRYMEDNIALDGMILMRIADHYNDQPNAKRSLSVVTVRIESK